MGRAEPARRGSLSCRGGGSRAEQPLREAEQPLGEAGGVEQQPRGEKGRRRSVGRAGGAEQQPCGAERSGGWQCGRACHGRRNREIAARGGRGTSTRGGAEGDGGRKERSYLRRPVAGAHQRLAGDSLVTAG